MIHQERFETVSYWTNDEIEKIGRAEEFQIGSLRSDGTLRCMCVL